MKKAFLLLAVLVIAAIVVFVWTRAPKSGNTPAPAVAVAPAAPPPKTIVRIYFTGAANLAGDTNSAAFTNIFCCSQAHALESQTLDKLSHAPGTWFKDKLPTGASDGSAQLRPLLDDFLKSEWVFEMRDATPSPEYALAIRLDDTRAQLWQTNLRSLLESWTQIKARDITNGWELKKDLPPNLFRIVRAGDWLVIGCGQDNLPLSDAWAGGTQPDENETSWASAKVDWPRLAEIFPVFAKFDLPAVQMQVLGRDGNLLSQGTFELSQPLPPLGPWQIPTNIIFQPLTSFTAVRGFGPWLERQPWAKRFQLSPEPDQAFIWSLGISPLQTFLAVPVTNGVTALAKLGQNLDADTNWEKECVAHVALERTNNRIGLRHIPFVTPEVQVIKEPSGQYLLADGFPNLEHGKAPPPQLFQAADHTNMVFYHWEITSERFKELPELTQLALLLTRHRQLDPTLPAAQWLAHISPTLGNCVTEVTQTGPSELSFMRSGQAGLTTFELFALANWLEAPNFPGFDISMPPPRKFRPTHHPEQQPQKPSQPPVPPPAPTPTHK